MIKKIVLTVSIIILSLFINTNVHADEAIRNYQLIYDIIELNISDTDITFDGWAFINDIDNNKRIDSSKPNTYKNITMSIVAKQYNNKTKKNVDILEIPVESYNGKYNKYLYESNCMKWSSEENSNELSECIENYESSSCDITYKNGKQITVIPSCRQDDIGFNVKVNIAKVKSKIINNTPVYFYLRVYDKEKLSGKEVWEKSIGVNTQSVKGKTNNNEIKVDGFSKKARIEQEQARILKIENNNGIDKVVFSHGNDFVWKILDSFEILGTYELKNSKKFGTLKMYKLRYYTNLTDEFRDGDGYGEKTSKYKYEETGWAHAGWITIEGNVYMTFNDTSNCPAENKTIQDEECQETTYNETKNYVIEKNIETTKEDHPYPNRLGNCVSYIKKTLRGEISVKQTGTFNLSLDSSQITAGMGFNMSADYIGKMTYDVCKEKDDIPELAYTIIYSYYDAEEGCKLGTEVVEIKDKNSPEWKWFAEEAQKKISNPSNDKKTVTSYDSNKYSEKNKNKTTINRWKATYTEAVKDNKWMPGEEITYSLKFNLDNACINVQNATIRYTEGNCNPVNEIDGKNLYYTPLKYMDKEFPVWIEIDNLNMLKGNRWDLNYACNVNVKQKLYNENYSYKFIYRPITFASPFPNRLPLNNWVKLYEDKDEFAKAMSRDNLEYKITLTPKMIASIKNYNKKEKYTSLKGISKDGKSSYLSDLIGTDRTNTFNKLGECTNNCWITESINGVNK